MHIINTNWEIYNLALAYLFILCILGRYIGTILEFTISKFSNNINPTIQRVVFFILSAIISFFVIQIHYAGNSLGAYMSNTLGTIGLVVIIFVLLFAMKYLAHFSVFIDKYFIGMKLVKTIIIFALIMGASFSLGGTIDFMNPLSWLYMITVFFSTSTG